MKNDSNHQAMVVDVDANADITLVVRPENEFSHELRFSFNTNTGDHLLQDETDIVSFLPDPNMYVEDFLKDDQIAR